MTAVGKTNFARRLRRHQTDAERLLWFRLRDRRLAGWKFKRQVPIDRFIVDFFCSEAKLILEIDGGQHDGESARDAGRTAVLESMGYLVLRFWNSDIVRNIDSVLEEILSTIDQAEVCPPHPNPLPVRTRVYPSSALFISGGSRIYPTSAGEREHT